MKELQDAIRTYKGKHKFVFSSMCSNKLSIMKTTIKKKKREKHTLQITQRICGHCRHEGYGNIRNIWTWWAAQETGGATPMTPSIAAGAQVAAAAGGRRER